MSLLQVENLDLYYQTRRGEVQALQGVGLQVGKGEVVGLVGESGCGKTSLARAITGVIPRNATIRRGAIRWKGRTCSVFPQPSTENTAGGISPSCRKVP